MKEGLPEYIHFEGVPGDYFNCPTGCTISVDRCRQTYQQAKSLKDQDISRWRACIGCRIGALHCGEKVARPVRIRNICVRCHEFAFRLLASGICVGCANRAAEVKKGRNRRGGVPNAYETFWGIPEDHLGKCKTVRLHDINLAVNAGRKPHRAVVHGASTMLEAVMRITRQERVQTDFGWSHGQRRAYKNI